MSADAGFISLVGSSGNNLDAELLGLSASNQHQNTNSRYSRIVNDHSDVTAQLQRLNSEMERLQNQRPKTQQPPNSSSLSSFAACATGLFSLAVTNSLVIDKLVPSLIDRGICLNNFISVSIMKNYRSLMSPIMRGPTLIHNFLFGEKPGNPFFKTGIIAPVWEEMEYRFLIQHVLLKKIPEHILNKIAPNYAEIINKWPVQLLRAFTVALLFAIAHGQAQSCESWGGLPQLMSGLLYGLLNEASNGNIILTMNLHMIHNMFVLLTS